jgi:hypothetical protein
LVKFVNLLKGPGRTQSSPLPAAVTLIRLGLLLALTFVVLLTTVSLTVQAQSETEATSTPQELAVEPSADPRTVRESPTVQATDPSDLVTIGLNFRGSELFVDSNFIPPDTMGAVGPDNIVEMINGRFKIYNKTTGAPEFSISLDGFWTTVVGLTIMSGYTFDPRIVYDPASGRWFATSIDSGAGNNIYLARSDTSDPTGDWDGVRFPADIVGVAEFHDYDTLAVDADGVYICTNDFYGGGNESCYSIPKSDLLLATPSVARLTRFEATPAGLPSVIGSIQPVLDFGPSDGRAALVGVSLAGTLVRGNILGAGGAGASLGTVVNIAGAPFTSQAPPARQPHPSDFTIENVSPRIVANVFEQGDSLWAVHAVLGSSGSSAIRWYEINESTNTVVQTGLIEDSNEDYHEPSIAVNEFGNVVIGYTCSGPTLEPSACVSVGETVGGVTTFESPLVLRLGAGHYYRTDSNSRNRWGDYSATVIDPADPCTFWTFQEFVAVSAVGNTGGSWGIQITELTFNSCEIQSGFVDVPPGFWAEDYIYAIFDAGITTGCAQNPLRYCPYDPVNRAQMAAFIVRALEGEPPANYCDSGSPFSDVPTTHPMCKYIKRLFELGITTGYSDGTYRPTDTVNRAQMAAFIVRALEGEPSANYCATGSPFSDVPPSHPMCKYIKRLFELGITTGYGDGTYRPTLFVNRAQMAAFLARAFLGMQ